MRIINRLTLGAATVAIAACYTGPNASNYYGVTNGGGIKATVRVHRKTTKGELLEVRDSSMVLLDGCKLTVVPFVSIGTAQFAGINPAYAGGMPTRSERAELKTLSRFPGGAPQEVLDHYLQCASMTAPAVIGARDSAAAFLATARVAVRRYVSLDSAIASGYRQLGGDLPSLGEHWINPALVMFGRIDASRPSILIYIRTPTGPVLAGAAWTTVLGADDPYPSGPAGPGAWHEHNGSVADETLPMMHQHGMMASHEATRVAIVHAWIGIENPRGVWVAENWALPFARAGLRADHASIASARAMSLTAPEATSYYERVIATAAGSDSAGLARARALLTASTREAMTVRRDASSELSDAQLTRLGDVWTGLWSRVTNGAAASGDEQLRRLALAMQ